MGSFNCVMQWLCGLALQPIAHLVDMLITLINHRFCFILNAAATTEDAAQTYLGYSQRLIGRVSSLKGRITQAINPATKAANFLKVSNHTTTQLCLHLVNMRLSAGKGVVKPRALNQKANSKQCTGEKACISGRPAPATQRN
ncbi:MAG: hypothetical protein H7211_09040 [Aquabacterium sp.]|nr:hypothetical protein [Ferruginibacter sp.]